MEGTGVAVTSMQMRVRHATTYAYDGRCAASYSEARLTPLTTTEQFVRRSRLEVTPTAWSQEYRDYWGATVTAFEVTEPHEELVVVATSTVDTAATPVRTASVGWDAFDAATRDRYCEFLAQSDKVLPAEDLVPVLDEIRARSARPVDYVDEVCALLNSRIKRLVAATHVTATAGETWTLGKGVCHDITHIAIGALRHAGIPARFVAGYLHPALEPEVGAAVVTEPHAWLEWWDGRWIGWDVAFGLTPGGRHIIVSRGRDFDDNPDLRGIYATEGPVTTTVSVEITRLA